jgi:hypothetical protein
MVDRFVKGKEASIILRIHQRTLYQWVDTKSNYRLYNVDKYLREMNMNQVVTKIV